MMNPTEAACLLNISRGDDFMLRTIHFVSCMMACLCLLGCEPAPTQPQTNPPAATATPAAPLNQATQPNAAAETSRAAQAAGVALDASPSQGAELARAGVGKQGQSLRNETGVGRMIAQPAITLFAVRQRAVFEIQIPHALALYKATNGNDPKTHDEFMTHIIKANNINLPELPEGRVYRYHPDEGLLYVHPANE